MWPTVTAIFGAVAGAVGLIFTWSANRRSQYDRVLVATANLTTGSIADCRHRIGAMIESVITTTTPTSISLPPAQINDYFDVLWAFDRP